jgi:hypothetical protein
MHILALHPRGIHHPPPHTGVPIFLYIRIKDNYNTQRVDESDTESKPDGTSP